MFLSLAFGFLKMGGKIGLANYTVRPSAVVYEVETLPMVLASHLSAD